MNTEHVDIGLARYSDWAFTSSVVVLVAALLLLAVELAYTRGRRVESREVVGAAAAATSVGQPQRRRHPVGQPQRGDIRSGSRSGGDDRPSSDRRR